MALSNDTLIGHLVEIAGNRFTARLLTEEEGFRPAIEIDDETVFAGQLGSYVAIEHNDTVIYAMVSRVSVLHKGHDVPLSRTFPAASGVVNLLPLGEAAGAHGFTRGVKHFPPPGAPVHAVGMESLKAVFARHREYRYNLGYLHAMPGMGVYLDPVSMFSRHFAVLGQSGSGKSWGLASLIQRAVAAMPDAHFILLDLHGEYGWRTPDGDTGSSFAPGTARYLDARELEMPYWLMTYAELVDLLVDPSDPSAAVQSDFLRDTLFSLKQAGSEELKLEAISVDAPVYFSMTELYKRVKEANEMLLDFGKLRGPLYGQFDKFLIRLQSRLGDSRYNFLLRPQRRVRSQALSDLLRDFVGLGEPRCQVTVIDLSVVPFDVRPMVSAMIGRIAFEFNYWNPRRRDFPIVLVCEEAHNYIPNDHAPQYASTRKAMERIAKEGRKYGVGLGVVSQRPAEVSETVLSQCGTYFCFRISNPDDQAYVCRLVPEGESSMVDILTALGRGECMALGEAVPLPIRFQVHRPDPAPRSNDVDYFTAWRGGTDVDIEDIVRRWQRQGR